VKALIEGAPEGVRVDLHLLAKPKTVEEFDAIIEAAGGVEKFRAGYGNDTVVTTLGEHGEEDDERAPYLMVEPPPGTGSVPRRGHPFITKFLADAKAEAQS
jgi:hypothetical protein